MEDVSSAHREMEKKPRRRMKEIRKMILKQMEFYFSDSNLQKDRFIKKEMEKSKAGYVDLSIFLKFNRVKTLTQDIKVVAKALVKSNLLQVGEDGKTVRRMTPLAEPKDIDDRTVYIECLPRNVTHDWVKKIFAQCGDVAYVSLPRYQSTGDSKGFGFVEFLSKDGANKAIELLNNPPPESSARAGKFPKSNKTLSHLQKKTGVSADTEENKMRASTDDAINVKSCKKNRKRRRCASESSVDFVSENLQIMKHIKLEFPEVKCEKKEFEHGLSTVGDSLVKQENKSKQHAQLTMGDSIVKQENKPKIEVKTENKTSLTVDGKKRKLQRLSDGSQEEDLKDSIVNKDAEKVRKHSSGSEQDKVRKHSSGSEQDKVRKHSSGSEQDKVRKHSSGSEQDGEQRVNKKRKISKSEHVETAPLNVKGKGKRLSENKDQLDSSVTPQKMVRIDTSANLEISQQLSTKAQQKKEKRKRKKKHKEKDIPLPQLRVIPKKEWLSLRKEYLSLQKESMAMLKQKLKEVKTTENTRNEPGSIKNNESKNSEMPSVKHGRNIEFQEGVIVHVTSKVPMNRKQIKEKLVPDIQVAYFDVLDAAVDGYIRCKNPESAVKLSQSNNTECQFTLISGDKEKAYWSKLAADQEAKLSSKNRSKKRGTQKLIDKAHKHNSRTMERKHVIFED